MDKWLQEKSALRSLPAVPFCAARPRPVKVNTYSLITLDRNQYSAPCQYIGQMLVAKAYVDRVDIIHGSQVVATHTRCYARGQVMLEIAHYLPAIERKPHSVTHAAVVRQLPAVFGRLREKMVQAHSLGYKDFLALLLLLREHSVAEVAAALEALAEDNVTVEAVRQKLFPVAPEPSIVNDVVITISDAALYDRLLVEAV